MLLDGLLNFASYFLSAILMVALFSWVYIKVTPYDEVKLILEDGNEAAAYALIGAVLGFVLPVAVIIAHSVSWFDYLVWALVAATVQLAVAAVITRGMRRFGQLMVNDLKAAGIVLGGVHLAVGMLNAASMTY
jgi:putative membrane protein